MTISANAQAAFEDELEKLANAVRMGRSYEQGLAAQQKVKDMQDLQAKAKTQFGMGAWVPGTEGWRTTSQIGRQTRQAKAEASRATGGALRNMGSVISGGAHADAAQDFATRFDTHSQAIRSGAGRAGDLTGANPAAGLGARIGRMSVGAKLGLGALGAAGAYGAYRAATKAPEPYPY